MHCSAGLALAGRECLRRRKVASLIPWLEGGVQCIEPWLEPSALQGCLGHGEVDLYRGQLLPMRVGGALEHRQGGLAGEGEGAVQCVLDVCRLCYRLVPLYVTPTLRPAASPLPAVRHVAAGSHLTVAITTGGRVFQMGVTGASAPSKHCPWEGATLPELVRGQLQGGCRACWASAGHLAGLAGVPICKRLSALRLCRG